MNAELSAADTGTSPPPLLQQLLPLIREAKQPNDRRKVLVVDDDRVLLFSGKNVRLPDLCYERGQSPLLSMLAVRHRAVSLDFKEIESIRIGPDEFVGLLRAGLNMRRIEISGAGKRFEFLSPSDEFSLLASILMRLANLHNWDFIETQRQSERSGRQKSATNHPMRGFNVFEKTGLYVLPVTAIGALTGWMSFNSISFGAFILILLLLFGRKAGAASQTRTSADKAGIEPFRSTILSWLLKLTGLAMLITYLWVGDGNELISACIFMFIAWILHTSQRLAARPITKTHASRGVGYCLYLRSFNRDLSGSFNESKVRCFFFGFPMSFSYDEKSFGSTLFTWANPMVCYRLLLLKSCGTAEEQLFSAINLIVPVVAIGKPGDKINVLGAGRTYVTNEVWQKTVTDSLETAAFVIIQPGSSKHIFWEIDQSLAKRRPDQILFWLTGMNGSQSIYDDVRLHIEGKTGLVLPRALGRNHFLALGPGQPKMLQIRDSHPFLWPLRGCSADFKKTLHPFLGPLFGWPPQRPPPQYSSLRKFLRFFAASTFWHVILLAIIVAQIGTVEFLVGSGHPPKATLQANASLPIKGTDWEWNLGKEWSDVAEKPATFTQMKIKPGTADQLICGISVQIGVTTSLSQLAKGIQIRTRSLPGVVDFRHKNSLQVKSGGIVWEQFEFTSTMHDIPLHYIYRVYCSPSGSYTLVGWSVQSDFDEHKSEFLHAFDSVVIKKGSEGVAKQESPTVADNYAGPYLVTVDEAVAGGQGSALGILPGDVILRYHGQALTNMAQLIQLTGEVKDEAIPLEIQRGKEILKFTVKPGKLGIKIENRPRSPATGVAPAK